MKLPRSLNVRNHLPSDTGSHHKIHEPSISNCLFKKNLEIPSKSLISILIPKDNDNEKLNDLYSLPNIVRVVKSRRMRWAGHMTRMGEERGVHRVLVGKPDGKRPLGRPRRRWEDNIKMDVDEVGGDRGGWMELAQDVDEWRALVSTVKNFRVP
jgi:hypothetical protein